MHETTVAPKTPRLPTQDLKSLEAPKEQLKPAETATEQTRDKYDPALIHCTD